MKNYAHCFSPTRATEKDMPSERFITFYFQAIDRFGETCRSIAARLVTLKQIFDKTDLSISDSQETEHVLDVHGQMWFDVRDDINNAQLIGNTQLKCMKVR